VDELGQVGGLGSPEGGEQAGRPLARFSMIPDVGQLLVGET
jgi:hypothetical protein